MDKKESNDLHLVELKSKWTFWEGYVNEGIRTQDKKDLFDHFAESIRQIITVQTLGQLAYVTKSQIVDFQNIFTTFAQGNNRTRKAFTIDGNEQIIDAIGLFREGIMMKWEDPNNSKGSDFSVRIVYTDENNYKLLKNQFIDIVAFLVSEQFEHSDKICGIRIVDKAVTGKPFAIQIEFWFQIKTKDPEYEQIKAILFKQFPEIANCPDRNNLDHANAK